MNALLGFATAVLLGTFAFCRAQEGDRNGHGFIFMAIRCRSFADRGPTVGSYGRGR